MYQWESYVSSHNNKYYIYNFNIPQYDNSSTIGVTEPGQRVRAAHNRADHDIPKYKRLLKEWEKSIKLLMIFGLFLSL
jgi:tmRNA-binding protein